MIKAPRLKKGGTIGIVCPSYHIDQDIYQRTSKILLESGFKLVEGRSVQLQYNLYAGKPQERATDIMEMFQNPQVDAIVCARGGYGANRVLELLDFDVIKQNPKIFIGYSDITAYLISMTQNTGLVTFHGPMLVTYKNGFVDYDYDYFIKCLGGEAPFEIIPPAELPTRVLKRGKAVGPLWGGNLCLLINRLGTPGHLNTDNSILFIEDVGEQHYRLDRMMVQMHNAGMFVNIKGLVMGEFVDMEDTDPPFGNTTDEIVMDVCGNLDIPIIANFPCGHGKYQATLPISVAVELNAEKQIPSLTILDSPVR